MIVQFLVDGINSLHSILTYKPKYCPCCGKDRATVAWLDGICFYCYRKIKLNENV